MRKNIWLFLISICFTETLHAQTTYPRKIQVGPNGTDTSSFSNIYFFREGDDLKDSWIGLSAENYNGIVCKGYLDNAYELFFPSNGKQVFYCTTYDSKKVKVELDLSPKSQHYLSFKVSRTHGNEEMELTILDEKKGMELKNKYFPNINKRFSIISSEHSGYFSDVFRKDGNAYDKMDDSINWKFDKELYFSFLLPGHLDYKMNSNDQVVYGYGNEAVSTTYTELLSCYYYGEYKIRNKSDFEELLQKEIFKTICEAGPRNKNCTCEIISEYDHTSGDYNALLFVQSEDLQASNKGTDKSLFLKNALRIMIIKNRKGHQFMVGYFLSERGFPEELSSKEELLERFKTFDQSLQLHSYKKYN